MNIQNSVFYVGGSKGGVGKSLFSFALVDYLLNRNTNILLVDTDTDNPDVFKAHKELVLSNLLCRLNSLYRTPLTMPWSSMPPPAPRPARPVTATS